MAGIFRSVDAEPFKRCLITDQMNVIDFYDTLLKAYGVKSGIGTPHSLFKHAAQQMTSLFD